MALIDELRRWDLKPPVVCAGAGYGEVTAFRQDLDDRRIDDIVQQTGHLGFPARLRARVAGVQRSRSYADVPLGNEFRVARRPARIGLSFRSQNCGVRCGTDA
ncbi:MAG: hypothetical protein QOJ85_4599 [Solirubrobacteraceae bacterium]|jgi:hypothetical protein|nr:hypothetical protein [Solirubrobacteraceae bacterium]